MTEYRNILLINFGGIGDEILFMPVIQSLKKTYPSASLTLCLEERSKAFLNLTSLIDKFFFINIKTKNKYFEIIKLYLRLLFSRYDLVISAGSNPLIAFLLFFSGIKTRVGYNSSKFAKYLLTHTVPLNKNQYASCMYYDLVKPVSNADYEKAKIEVEDINIIPNSVTVHPGVSRISVMKNITKTLPPQSWAEIIKRLLIKGKIVYLAGGPDDTECISVIRNELKDYNFPNFNDMFGKTKNIYDLARLIKSTEVLICSDSAPMHIGVGLDTKVVAIFGPTDYKKLIPEDDKYIPVYNNCECRPCLWDKRLSTCDKLDCLNIDINSVVNAV